MNLDTMVDTQIVARGIKDERLLKVMRSVPRDIFVPDQYKALAFSDQPLPIGCQQTISQPYIVALMTEMLHLTGEERVLEIGTGSGYQTAILANLAKTVYTVERISMLAERARDVLLALSFDNVVVQCSDGFAGLCKYGPYDAIIITCAPADLPNKLTEQLAEGGRMVVPVGTTFQQLMIIERVSDQLRMYNSISVRFVPMLKGIIA